MSRLARGAVLSCLGTRVQSGPSEFFVTDCVSVGPCFCRNATQESDFPGSGGAPAETVATPLMVFQGILLSSQIQAVSSRGSASVALPAVLGVFFFILVVGVCMVAILLLLRHRRSANQYPR